jgi:general secretion pathway protein D
VIQQSANVADIRLREGEVNILGGLSQSQDTTLVNGIPGLVNIPVLGKVLFGSDHTDKIKAELMIALVPHIVRTPDYSAENLRGIYAGTDQVVKINYAPKPGDVQGSILQPGAAAPVMAGVNPVPPAVAPQRTPAMPFPVPGVVTVAAPVAAAMPMGVPVKVSVQPSAMPANGGTLTVNVQVENGANLGSVAPLRIKYDADLLRLEDIAPGDIFSKGGGGATSTKDIRNDAGEASITISRLPGAPGVSGPGTLAVLTFTAIGSGEAPLTVEEVALKDAQSQAVGVVAPAALGVRIQ